MLTPYRAPDDVLHAGSAVNEFMGLCAKSNVLEQDVYDEIR